MGNMTVQVKRPNQEINVNITDVDSLEIMKFLRHILADDTKVLNVPITQPLKVTQDGIKTSVQYPTSKNLLEPQEASVVSTLAGILPKGAPIECEVDCPECQVRSKRNAKVGGIIVCYCGVPLYVSRVDGKFVANERFSKK